MIHLLSVWPVALLTLTLLVLLYSALLTLHCWEYRRFVRSRLAHDIFHHGPAGTWAAVVAPCKGADGEFEGNLRALFEQDYRRYTIVFVVESEEDGAAPVIRRLMEEYGHVSAHLLVAGRAGEGGQKVHNLLAATDQLPEQYGILAFTDADARHNPNWLRGLAEHLFRAEIGASTGYRWIIPARPTLANLLLYSVNSAVAGLFDGRHTRFVWGGSWAIQRRVLDRVGLRDAWRGTLSDDLVARRVIRRAGMRIEFEPRCLAASPADVTLVQLFEFLRRQHLIGRRYAPHYWLPALAANSLCQLAGWGNLVASAWGLAGGWPWWWASAAACAGLYGLSTARGWLRQGAGRRMLPDYAARLTAARRFDIWAGPVAGLANCASMWAALAGAAVTWRGIRYRIARGGRAVLLSSQPSSAFQPPQPAVYPIRALPAADTQPLRRTA